jgi:hypothetical protein
MSLDRRSGEEARILLCGGEGRELRSWGENGKGRKVGPMTEYWERKLFFLPEQKEASQPTGLVLFGIQAL